MFEITVEMFEYIFLFLFLDGGPKPNTKIEQIQIERKMLPPGLTEIKHRMRISDTRDGLCVTFCNHHHSSRDSSPGKQNNH